MAPDFYDAANRHWEDANHLLTSNRKANADYHLGLSAECALKKIMCYLGMELTNGIPPKEYKNHINNLWDQFISFAYSRNGARFIARINSDTNPFIDWDINQRYENRSFINDDNLEKHRQETENIIVILQEMDLDGGLI